MQASNLVYLSLVAAVVAVPLTLLLFVWRRTRSDEAAADRTRAHDDVRVHIRPPPLVSPGDPEIETTNGTRAPNGLGR